MNIKNLFIAVLISLLFITMLFGQSKTSMIDEICSNLEKRLSIRYNHWNYNANMLVNAWQPDYVDETWKTLAIDERVFPDSAWLRKTIVIPQKIAGKNVAGGKIKLKLTVDDAGICWINGVNKGLFKWNGEYVLTENAKAGEEFKVAIKAINTGGPMRLLEAKIEWDEIEPLSTLIQDYIVSIKTGQKLLSDDTYMKTGRIQLDNGKDLSSVPKERKLALRQILHNAVSLVDINAMDNGNLGRFEKSLQKSRKALKPVGDFAQEFTLVFDSNAHIDCAWLWRYLETINVAKNTFNSVLEMMDARPDFTYTQSQAHLFWWMEDMYPDIFKRIGDRVKDERWELIGGMWVEPDCNLISGESWARQLLYGQQYFKDKFNADIKIGWNPDSFGYNWNMPQFFRDAGIDAFVTQKIGWNDTNMFPYRLFWWESPDGTRLLTYFPNSYVNQIKNPYNLVDWLRQFEANTGFKKMLILYGVGDHGGGPDLEMISRIEELKKLDVYPKVEYGTTRDYLSWIRESDLTDLPVWKDELYLEYHRGTYTSQAKTKKYNRESEIAFSNAEQAATIASLYGRPYSNTDFFQGWRGVLFNQFHDILPGSSIHPVYKDSDELYEQSLEIARHEFDKSINHLAKQIDTNVRNNSQPVLIYNSLPWQRSDVVELVVPKDNKYYSIYNKNGKEIKSQVVSAGRYQNKLIFIAEDIPSMGYAVYELIERKSKNKKSVLKADQLTLENNILKVDIDDQTGWLKSIFSKLDNREYLSGAGNELQLFKDKPANWDAWNIGLGERYPLTFRNIELIESGPVRAVVRVKHDFLKPGIKKSYPTPNNPNSYFTQDIILYDGINRIDFRTLVDWWEEHVMLKVSFSVSAKNSSACYEIPFGTIYRPTTKNNNWEKARFEVNQHKWSDLTDASNDFGISLLNRSKYGGDIHGNVMRLSLLKSPKWPDPQADMGKHEIEYSIYPHSGCWKKGGSMRRGYEYNYPLIAKIVKPGNGSLPKAFSFVNIEPSNVMLHTIKIAEPNQSYGNSEDEKNKNVWIVRLFEFQGKNTGTVLTFPENIKAAWSSNILEEDGEALKVNGNKVELKIAPFRVQTVKVLLDR